MQTCLNPKGREKHGCSGDGQQHVSYLMPKIGSTKIGTKSRTEEALERWSYRDVSRIRTTSESVWPRNMARLLPSGDHANVEICSALKDVIRRPDAPSSGCAQRLSTPLSRMG